MLNTLKLEKADKIEQSKIMQTAIDSEA